MIDKIDMMDELVNAQRLLSDDGWLYQAQAVADAISELSRLQSLSDQNRLTGGWRAVPEEPTREMLGAARKVGHISPEKDAALKWAAMLAASPPLPLPGGEEKR